MEEDVLDIREIVKIVLKYRYVAVACVVVSIIAGISLIYSQQSDYKSYIRIKNAVVEKSVIPSNRILGIVLSSEVLLPALNDYNARNNTNYKSDNFGGDLNVVIENDINFRIIMKSGNNSIMQELLNLIAEKYVEYSRPLLEQSRIEFENKAAEYDSNTAHIKAVVEKLESAVQVFTNNPRSDFESLYKFSLIDNSYRHYLAKNEKILQQKAEYAKIAGQMSHAGVLAGATEPKKEPVEKSKIIISSILIGIIAGFLATLIVNYFANMMKGLNGGKNG